jgi:hypothetical protein
MFDYEQRSRPLLPFAKFLRRLWKSFLIGMALIIFSLLAGMLGYHTLEHLSWIDSFENAAMILSGMGPLWQPQSFGGKLFAGMYALYSGLAVLVIAAIAFGPLVHRFFHRFHAE